MAKYTSKLSLLVLFLLAPLAVMAAESEVEALETTQATSAFSEVQLTAEGRTVHIKNAAGLKLEVFNVTCVLVSSVKIDSQEKSVTLSLDKGIYILRVGNVTRKVKFA